MRDDVYAELERTAVDRRRERVIDDARYAVRVCGVCKHFEVCHDERRVRKRFRKHTAGVLAECGVQLVLILRHVRQQLINIQHIKSPLNRAVEKLHQSDDCFNGLPSL